MTVVRRKDKKGRVLRECESQRPNGLYEYKYTDLAGHRHSKYSWKLEDTDILPPGKRSAKSLRSIEKEIKASLNDGLDVVNSKKTLDEAFEDNIRLRNLKDSTRQNYKYMYNKFIKPEYGHRPLSWFTYSKVKKIYVDLYCGGGFKPNSLEVLHTILNPIFDMAVRDDIIRKNPALGIMKEIKRDYNWEHPKRHALTKPQQQKFVSFLKNSKKYSHWLPIFAIFLGTGCRVGELIGLRWEDVDFQKGEININHNLIYRKSDGEEEKCQYQITTPKTKAGVRIIPMLSDVKRILEEEKEKQAVTGYNETVIDGYTNFIFKNRYGTVVSPPSLNRAIDRIVEEANADEEITAKAENREPVFLPHFSVHNLRHTFCTRFCENETNIKVIQEIMGHSDISTTMDIYNEATKEAKKESISSLEGKITIC